MTQLHQIISAAIAATIILASGPIWFHQLSGAAIAANTGFMHEPSAPIKDIKTQDDLDLWYTYYYLFRQPDLTIKVLNFMQKNGLDKTNARAPFIAFLSFLFAQNPTKLALWMPQFKTMPESMKALIWTSLWQANTAETKNAATELAKSLGAENQAAIAKMPAATPILQMPVNSPATLDMLWAGFSATGDDKYVMRIINSMNGKDMIINGAAKWSLASNAVQHKRVLATCVKAQQQVTDPKIKKILVDTVKEAQTVLKKT